MAKLITDILDKDQNPVENHLLVSNVRLDGTAFERSVIYMCDYDEDGAMGFMINKVFGEIEFKKILLQMGLLEKQMKNVQNIPVYYGGPVEIGKGYVLHSDDFADESTKQYANGLSITANTYILEEIALGRGPKKSIFVLGHSSWAPGQLEREIQHNSWFLVPSTQPLILGADCDKKWDAALGAGGIKRRRLSDAQGHA